MTRPPSSSTSADEASRGGSPSAMTARVSAATDGRCATTPSGTAVGPTGRSGRRARGRPRDAGPGSPAPAREPRPRRRARGSSAVSSTTTSPSWCATAVPGRGVAWISTSSGASVTPASVTEPSGSKTTSPSRAAAITAGIADPRRFPILGSSGLTRRSTSAESSSMTTTFLTLISSAISPSRSSPIVSPRSGSAIQAVASGWRVLRWARAPERPGEVDDLLGDRHRGLERLVAMGGQVGASASASDGRYRARRRRPS